MITKYFYIPVSLVFVCVCLLMSCVDSGDLSANKLIGIWESTRVDSLYQFIVPEKPDTFVSSDYKGHILEISEAGSFEMIILSDTIIGQWNQTALDSLKLKVEKVSTGLAFSEDSKIEYLDSNELILSNNRGFISASNYAGESGSITKHIKYEARVHYVRKPNN